MNKICIHDRNCFSLKLYFIKLSKGRVTDLNHILIKFYNNSSIIKILTRDVTFLLAIYLINSFLCLCNYYLNNVLIV